MKKFTSPDRDDVKKRAEGSWDRILSVLAPHLGSALEKMGHHVPCPVHGGIDGYRVFKNTASTGGSVCNTCGVFPDGFATLCWANDWNFNKAVVEVDSFLGGTIPDVIIRPLPQHVKASTEREDAAIQRRLLAVWRGTLPIEHEKAEPLRLYLASRGLTRLPELSVRFHPKLAYYDEDNAYKGHFPAMVSQVTGLDGKGVTIHRTYLTKEGNKADVVKAKKMMSHPSYRSVKGAAIRLAKPGLILGVAEGIETALAVMELTGSPCWATMSDTIMQGFEPPPGVGRIVIYADKDVNKAGEIAAQKLVKRLWEMDIAAGIKFPHMPIPQGNKGIDWLDVLNSPKVQRRIVSS